MMSPGKTSPKPETTPRAAPRWQNRLGDGLILAAGPRPPESPGLEQVLWLQAGRAFPLGHPTTRLCLELLTETLAARPCQTLAEVGCGSGVICVAAAALGVGQVTGVDIARSAVLATRANARRNGLGKIIGVAQGSAGCLRGPFELVVANLPWEVQLELAPELLRLAVSGGRLILSGFRDNQEEALLEKYQRQGWTLSRRVVKEFSHPEMPAAMSFTWVAWLLE